MARVAADTAQRCLAELLGTFALVFAGTGAITVNQQTGVITHTGIAIVFGLVVMAMIYALGDVSGAHFNPAVSIAFVLARRFAPVQLPFYILSQVTGALLASGTLRMLFPNDHFLGATLPAGSAPQSFILELLLAFFLMLVILRVSSDGKERGLFAGAAIGATVLLEAMFAGPVSGASMNPARSLAPALVSGHTGSLWIYLIAPVAGAALATPAARFLDISKQTT